MTEPRVTGPPPRVAPPWPDRGSRRRNGAGARGIDGKGAGVVAFGGIDGGIGSGVDDNVRTDMADQRTDDVGILEIELRAAVHDDCQPGLALIKRGQRTSQLTARTGYQNAHVAVHQVLFIQTAMPMRSPA